MTELLVATGARDYNELWRWSIEDIRGFWRMLWGLFDIQADGDASIALTKLTMPNADWFPRAQLSYPEHIFRGKSPEEVAVYYATEDRQMKSWTWLELEAKTAAIRDGLAQMGISKGDRVAAYMPNIPETIAAFLAVSSLGATWSCCSPDFGTRTVVDRFAQISPRILLAVDGYTYGGKQFDRRAVVDEIRGALPTVERTIVLPYIGMAGDWDDAFPATHRPLSFERVPFAHPLWIVYSSGTTGLPKPIVHGHGGPLLESLKTWRLHHDVKPGDRALWFSTTGWIMWNYLVGALLSPISIVLYDGSPAYPDLATLWDVADQSGVTFFGAGAAFLHGCMKAGIEPLADRKLSALRAIGSTGSPLSPEAYEWIRDHVGGHIWLSSTSGGTDVATGFVGPNPLMPVYAGELQGPMLGVAIEAWDADGESVGNGVGELVVTKPMPSMPVKFWGDAGDRLYTESYFTMYPGVWRHGDWIRISSHGSVIVYGRSDSTINRGGVRMGTAEIYAAIRGTVGVQDALVVDVSSLERAGEDWMGLFVVLADGTDLSAELKNELTTRIRQACSPRHIPDDIIPVPDVPRTLTGKLLEVPVKRILMGQDPGVAVSKGALANPAAMEWFIAFARNRNSPRADALPPAARPPLVGM